MLKLEMTNVQYDNSKSNFPYFIISKRTEYNLTAIPKLIVKKTEKVTGEAASVINMFFSKYLKEDFIPGTTEQFSRKQQFESIPDLSFQKEQCRGDRRVDRL